ncbi:hypothetical protein [Aeromicrobium sp. 50.2.37]|nr:hypothetical protein [Aeromicrobium sp. 50.2.37]MCR4513141.1 hypothetical protein [Aeromicrobium sp. 50.2.37]
MLEFLVAAEESAEGGHINPYIIGGVALAILLVLLFALLAFGKGREHS